MKVGDRAIIISVPKDFTNDLNRCGTITKIGADSIYGKNVDILLDGDDGVSAVFDHQLKVINYKKDPKVKLFDVTEEMIKGNEMDDGCFDNWFGLMEYDNKYAVDFNYCIDGYDGEVEEYSHFYGCFPDGEGNIIIDCNCYSDCYEIDFSNPDWKEKLFQAAYEFLMSSVVI